MITAAIIAVVGAACVVNTAPVEPVGPDVSTAQPRAFGPPSSWSPREPARPEPTYFQYQAKLANGQKRTIAFDHQQHFAAVFRAFDYEHRCADCHVPDAESHEPTRPLLEGCYDCHSADFNLPEVNEYFIALSERPEDERFANPWDLTGDVVFSHANHTNLAGFLASSAIYNEEPDGLGYAGDKNCATCHASTRVTFRDGSDGERLIDTERPTLAPGVTKYDCLDCHQVEGVLGSAMASDATSLSDCAICHTDARADVAPDNHAAANFASKSHGLLSPVGWRQGTVQAMGDCGFCHDVQQCLDCHTTQAPPSHSEAHWLSGPDGKSAHAAATPVEYYTQGFLGNCATCHEPQQCVDCHRNTPPRSHRINWMQTHGFVARSGVVTELTGPECGLCHTQQECIDCHMNETPRNHTAHFMIRGHGFEAALDRQRCRTCHVPQQCESCHFE